MHSVGESFKLQRFHGNQKTALRADPGAVLNHLYPMLQNPELMDLICPAVDNVHTAGDTRVKRMYRA